MSQETEGGPGTVAGDPSRLDLPVSGMTCAGCADLVERELSRLEGVRRVDADPDAHRVTVHGTRLEESRLHAAITGLGYTVAATPQQGGPRSDWWRTGALAAGLVVLFVAGTAALYAGLADRVGTGTIPGSDGVFGEVSGAGAGLALLSGLAVGFAPSSYAMAPAVVSVVTSATTGTTRRALGRAGAFVGGIVVVDVLLGVALAASGTAVLSFLEGQLALWHAVLAVLLVALGLVTLRWWRPSLPSFLPRPRPRHTTGGAFALGLPFGIFLCPTCTPLLLPVALGAAASGSVWYGAVLLGVFAVGRGLPMLVLGTSAVAFRRARGLSRAVPWVERTVGVLLLLGGAYFAAGFLAVGGFPALVN